MQRAAAGPRAPRHSAPLGRAAGIASGGYSGHAAAARSADAALSVAAEDEAVRPPFAATIDEIVEACRTCRRWGGRAPTRVRRRTRSHRVRAIRAPSPSNKPPFPSATPRSGADARKRARRLAVAFDRTVSSRMVVLSR